MTTNAHESKVLARALAGEEGAFAEFTEAHRNALLLHSYRMLGSPHDAEDAVQETWLRAWRNLSGFRGDASPRTWLMRIATHVCLDMLRVRARRILPQSYIGATDALPSGPPPEVPWLAPMPPAWLEDVAEEGALVETQYERRAAARLGFIAVIQHLPPRQRAALLLGDVLGWRTREVAAALDTSEPAVNSALKRARATVRGAFPDGIPPALPEPGPSERQLLRRYMEAWEKAVLRSFVALLREDAVLAMPPTPEWYAGAVSVERFLVWAWGPDGPGPFRLIPASPNGERGFALYGPDPAGAGFVPLAVTAIELLDGAVQTITGFIDPALFPHFGLPARL